MCDSNSSGGGGGKWGRERGYMEESGEEHGERDREREGVAGERCERQTYLFTSIM